MNLTCILNYASQRLVLIPIFYLDPKAWTTTVRCIFSFASGNNIRVVKGMRSYTIQFVQMFGLIQLKANAPVVYFHFAHRANEGKFVAYSYSHTELNHSNLIHSQSLQQWENIPTILEWSQTQDLNVTEQWHPGLLHKNAAKESITPDKHSHDEKLFYRTKYFHKQQTPDSLEHNCSVIY